MNRKLKNKIIELRNSNKTYNEIQKILCCSLGLISYHCGIGQKEKAIKRRKRYNKKYLFIYKINHFRNVKQKNIKNYL